MFRKLIATICTPEFEAFNDLTYSSRMRYASKCGAMHTTVRYVSEFDALPCPHFAKYKILIDARNAGIDQVLFVDDDVYIRKDAPDIFTAIGQTALRNEVPHPKPSVLSKSFAFIEEHLGNYDASRYYNTGVMLWQRYDLDDLAPLLRQAAMLQGPFYEQDELNYLIQRSGVLIHELSDQWNQCCGPRHLTPSKAKRAYFLHGNGTKKFSDKLKRFQKIIEEYP